MITNLADLRREYTGQDLDENSVLKEPLAQFQQWLEQAITAELQDATAMTLATKGEQGPNARIVLLKDANKQGFTFFGNYDSQKGRELSENPKATLLFYWREFSRQIRIQGVIEKISRQESQEYFNSRPRESQIAAVVSNQSQILENRQSLMDSYSEAIEKFKNSDIPCPENWGGYRLLANYYEFWQGQENRLHDRISYKKNQDGWQILRLAP